MVSTGAKTNFSACKAGYGAFQICGNPTKANDNVELSAAPLLAAA